MRNLFRKGTMAALVIGLIFGVVGLAVAGYNIRQNSDGTTDWVDNEAAIRGGDPVIRVGRQYFLVRVTNLADALTQYFASPVSGVLFSAFVIQNTGPIGTMTTSLTFGVMNSVSLYNFIHPTTGGSFSVRASADPFSVFYNKPHTSGFSVLQTPQDVTQMQGPLMSVRRGGVISIASGGEGGASGANGEFDIWIIIDPR